MLPGPDDAVTIDTDVVLSGEVTVRSCGVLAGASLTFDPTADAHLRVRANVEVAGRLVAHPSAEVRHAVTFVEVAEDSFVGGDHVPVATDVGLWVVGSGVLDVAGPSRTPWVELAASAEAGQHVLDVLEAPQGWQPGDELAICPTAAPSDAAAHLAFERRRVVSVTGARVELDQPLDHDHPLLAVAGFATRGAEVLNLTRNVVIGGTPQGRAHVLIHSDQPQTIVQARISDVGPQRRQGVLDDAGDEVVTPVLGRYALHFHESADALAESVVEGVVVTDCGNHAFVAHATNGLRFDGCVSFATTLAPFWWDAVGVDDATHDVRFERCVAAHVESIDAAVTVDTAHLVQRVAGFDLLRGRGNVASSCRAVGVLGGRDSAGFVWQEDMEGMWEVIDCVAHNNRHHGAFVWQNTTAVHDVTRFTSYANAGHGVVHGAYANGFRYTDCLLWGNAGHALLRHANAIDPAVPQTWTGCRFDPAGQGTTALSNGPHEFPPRRAAGDVVFADCTFTPGSQATIALFDATDIRSWCALHFVDCDVDATHFTVGDVYPGTRITVEQDGSTLVVIDS